MAARFTPLLPSLEDRTLFAWLQNLRHLVVRCEFHNNHSLGTVHPACILILLRRFWDRFKSRRKFFT